MIDLHTIWANARYEVITLLRSWFFRIFAGASLIIFIAINLLFFSGLVPVPRMFYGIPSGIPYANMIMLNIAQLAIIIFMASEFFKRDRKFNTSEVFYIRSMTNAGYLAGKAIGIFILFAVLNVLILLVAILVQLLFSDLPVSWISYLLYPVLVSFPAFIFMIGFSFLLMQIIKNQAVVVLLLLGYYAMVVFYLYDKWYYILDLTPIRLPLIYSDFTGFANAEIILLQRALYVSIGMVFMLVSILLFKRLHQSEVLRRLLMVLSAIFIALSFFLGKQYVGWYTGIDALRNRLNSVNQQYVGQNVATPEAYRISLNHHRSSLEGETFCRFINNNTSVLDTLLFSLNPGLQVTEIQHGETSLSFTRKDHLIFFPLPVPLQPGKSDSVVIHYSGTINEAICYPEVEDSTLNKSYTVWLYQIPKKQTFLERDYVLLPPESLWYPRPGLPPGSAFPYRQDYCFSNFELEVRTYPDLTGISQGVQTTAAPGHFRFQPRVRLPGISLILGRYQVDSVRVDTVTCRLYRLPGHDYYREYFSEIGDTLSALIRSSMQSFEVRLNLPYPFKRLSLVEVPIQYFIYPRPWTVAQGVVLPEQVWIQENLLSLEGADFRLLKRSMDRRLDRSNQSMTERESQISVFQTFINTTFFGENLRGRRFGGPPVSYKPDYSLFSNYYTYVVALNSARWPILNTAVEAFLFDRVKNLEDSGPIWFMEGLTPAEEVSQLLGKKSLAEYLSSGADRPYYAELINQKGSFLIKSLQYELGRDNFNRQLIGLLNANRFGSIDITTFTTAIDFPEKFDFERYLSSWYTGSELPAYLIGNINIYKVYDRDRIRTQLVFDIENTSATTGLFEVSFDYSSRGMGFGMAASGEGDPPRLYRLASGDTKRIGILLDEEPRELNINFMIARNLPLVFSRRFDKVELDQQKQPLEGEEIIPGGIPVEQPGEFIVDNESDHFQVYNPPFSSVLKRLIHGTGEAEATRYDRFQWWSPPHQWRLIKSATFFGTYIHSAYYIRAGDGQKIATWETEIPADGIYDIYVYMFNQEDFMRRNRNRRREIFQEFNYTVYHTAGVENVQFSADGAPEGWNFIGSWYLSAGKAKVTLSDETSGRLVIADAVKWVKN